MFKNKGFSIIELVISIFILSIAVVGLFTAFSIINILTADSIDRLTGAYLAQEGMEIVRNIRDSNWINVDACASSGACQASWIDGLSDLPEAVNNPISCSESTTGCHADYTSMYMIGGIGGYLCNENGFYRYNSCSEASRTKFKRKITITPIKDVDYNSQLDYVYHILKVKTQVSWDGKATLLNSSGFLADTCVEGANFIITEETLYNWYYLPSPEKIFLAFEFLEFPSIQGSIDQSATPSITVNLPNGTDQNSLEDLTAIFTFVGIRATVKDNYGNDITQISGATSNNFTAPVTYTVHAADGTTKDYTVRVNISNP